MLQRSDTRPIATAADHAACKALIRQGSKTFHAASLLLPHEVREPAYALYAFCRLADDAVDLGGDSAAVLTLHDRLDRVYEGRPLPLPSDLAFCDVVTRYAIPKAVPAALLEGLAWDTEGRSYSEITDLYDYAIRVAGTVGVMMSLLMGVRSRQALARACDLGIAMQLTNISRDVGEDARAKRLYLPLRWLVEEGVDPASWLREPVFDRRIARVTQRLLDDADRFYVRAREGIRDLPPPCRPAIHAAGKLYAEIGREVARAGFDSVTRRAVTSRKRKLFKLAEAYLETPFLPANSKQICEPAGRFLLDAVDATPAAGRVAFKSGVEKIDWTLDLFMRLKKREYYLDPGNRRSA